jgi:small-conductance mechanosensitive channel
MFCGMWLTASAPVTDIAAKAAFAADWVFSALVLVGAAAAALVLHAVIVALLRRLLSQRQAALQILLATKAPARLGLLLVAIAIALPAAPLTPGTAGVLARLLGVAAIILIGWTAMIAVHIAANLYLMRFQAGAADDLVARTHVTQVRVLLRAADIIIVLVTVGFALMTFATVRQYGYSLFASAGVASIVAGLAARPVLSNLFAGVQLAVTQPIRLEDAVTVENEFGWIEEITSTYVVVRLWDSRRLIVPLTYFIEKPFYNWSRHAAPTMGVVLLSLHYSAPVAVIRAKAAEFAADSKHGSGEVVAVQVTNSRPDAMEVRLLVKSHAANAIWDLCADVREKVIAFLKREHPDALPP